MMSDLNSLVESELMKLKHEGIKDINLSEENLQFLLRAYNDINLEVKHDQKMDSATEIKNSVASNIEKEKNIIKSEKKEIIDIALPDLPKKDQMEWLKNKVLNCEICKSHVRPGKNIVFGEGNIDADVFFCGEAPGAEEEDQGRPFVGRAGQLLTKMITATGLTREDVYIANIMNWRPEMESEFGNRPPTQQEMEVCLPYLKAQLAIVKPKIIVALGATAVSGLLGADNKRRMHDVRGKWFEFDNIPLIITFHPSYILRNNSNESKRQIWEDLLSVMERLNMQISEKQRGFFL